MNIKEALLDKELIFQILPILEIPPVILQRLYSDLRHLNFATSFVKKGKSVAIKNKYTQLYVLKMSIDLLVLNILSVS